MNKPFLISLGSLLLLALFFPIRFNQEFNVLGLAHHVWIGKDSFLIAFAAFFGLIQGFRVAPLLAMLIGSFLSGPFVVGVVAALFVYERSQVGKEWWFSLKDYFSLMMIVFASGLPEPYRSIATYIGIVGVSLNFNVGLFGLMPAVLLSRTAIESEISGEALLICAATFLLLHLLWVFGNGKEKAFAGWKNTLSLAIITFSLITKEQIFLPTVVILVLADQVLNLLSDPSQKRKIALLVTVVAICVGFPIFVTQAPYYVFSQRELLWAIPIFPFMMSYFGCAMISSNANENESFSIPWWSIIPLFVLATNALWWSSTFVPGSGLLDWGTDSTFMNFLFDKQAEKLGTVDQNSFIIIQALILVGAVLGFIFYRFYRPAEKIERIEQWLLNVSNKINEKLTRAGKFIPQKLAWTSERFSTAKPQVDDLLQHVAICLSVFALIWAIFSILRRGGIA